MTEAKTLSERIAAIMKLDAKRTQGRWKYTNENGCKTIRAGKSGTHQQGQYDKVGFTHGIMEFEDKANASFVCAAPEMVSIIRELQAHAEALRDALAAAVAAMHKSVDVGCTDHLDASDDAGAFWYDAIDDATTALAAHRKGD